MHASPRRWGSLARLGCLLIDLALLGLDPRGSLAEEVPPKGLPADVERVWRWLPEDTETVFVARSVTLTELNPDGDNRWQDVGVGFATLYLDSGDGEKYSKSLRGRKIEVVVRGAKNFDTVSSFGGLRGEGCTIVVFETGLGDSAREWTDGLRKDAKSVRTMLGREVFAFPPGSDKEPWIKDLPWEGTYFVLLKPNTLLCATSDRYLKSILERVDHTPESRAIPDNLPEWKYIDVNAKSWMIRHRPEVGEKIHIVGCTVTFLNDGFRVTYVPRVGSDPNPESIKRSWEQWLHGDPALIDRLKVVQQADDAVVASWRGLIPPSDSATTLGLGMQLYWLQGQEFVPPGE